jgi:chloramphenicol-sensitive protein RarD
MVVATGSMTRTEQRLGLAYAVSAYAWWGLVPVFWKQLAHVPPPEVLAHRVIWGFAVFALLQWLRGGFAPLLRALRARRTLAYYAASSALLACNWLTFIYAVATNRVLETSLGYFLNPTVSVILGLLFMGERLRRLQWVAVVLSAAGVAQLAAQASEPPWIALVLAVSFALYGLVRKKAPMEALPGSTLESGLAVPLAALYLLVVWASGTAHFGPQAPLTDLWLVTTGIITAAPLLWFAGAARRLPLSTIGILQYLAPTGQFLLAVLLYGERFTAVHARSFACIWAGVGAFILESWIFHGQRRRAAPPL